MMQTKDISSMKSTVQIQSNILFNNHFSEDKQLSIQVNGNVNSFGKDFYTFKVFIGQLG